MMTELPVALTMTQVAEVLNLTFTRGAKRGRPNRRLALELIMSGRLRVIDPQQGQTHWSVSRAEIMRYISGEPITHTLRSVAS